MKLTKRHPLRDLEDMLETFGRLPARLASQGAGHEGMTMADWVPTVDIRETDGEYLIKAELPEVNKDHVKVSLKEGVLVIQGERSMEKEEGKKKSKYHRIEREYGSFSRSFSLPEDVASESISAEHKEGMLYVHLPKHAVTPAKSVEVQVQ